MNDRAQYDNLREQARELWLQLARDDGTDREHRADLSARWHDLQRRVMHFEEHGEIVPPAAPEAPIAPTWNPSEEPWQTAARAPEAPLGS